MQKQSSDDGSLWRRRPTGAPDLDDLDTGLRPLGPLPGDDSTWAKALGVIGAMVALTLALIATIGR